MVNSNSKSPAALGAGTSSSIAGAGNNPGGSSAGSGSASVGAPPVGNLPPAQAKASSGFRKEVATIAGALGNIPDGSSVLVAGQSTPKSSIQSALAAIELLFGNVDAGVQALKQERLALEAALPGARQFIDNLKAGLVAAFGKGNPVLASFGLGGKKRRQLTVEEKTASKAKARKTRELRGTGGKRQKAAIKFIGKVDVQTSLSGTQTSGGNASPTASSNGGASPSGGAPAGAGSGPSQP